MRLTPYCVCATGAAVTTRGSYYPPGKEAGSDKLHLLVEAPDQMALTKAKGEIKRIVGAFLYSTSLPSPRILACATLVVTLSRVAHFRACRRNYDTLSQYWQA